LALSFLPVIISIMLPATTSLWLDPWFNCWYPLAFLVW
jgi:hypothetical protein